MSGASARSEPTGGGARAWGPDVGARRSSAHFDRAPSKQAPEGACLVRLSLSLLYLRLQVRLAGALAGALASAEALASA